MTTALEYATAYVDRGWYVFPCHSIVRGQCTCGKGTECASPGKHPRTRQGVKDASNDKDVITGWWTQWPDANIALACGRQSNVFVVDIDQRKQGFENLDAFEEERGAPLPTGLIALSGGGGRHLFYSYPADGMTVPNRNDWLRGVDVKSDGGYVILPYSVHISGGMYTWLDYAQVPVPAPLDLLQTIRSTGASGSAKEPLESAETLLNGVPEGKRDETLFRWACKLRRQLSGEADGGRAIIERLILEAAANSVPPFPRDEALRKVDQAFKQDHTDEAWDWDFLNDDGEPLRRLTDLGNALRFIDIHGLRLRYVDAWGWLQWSPIGWKRMDDATVLSLSREIPDAIRREGSGIEGDPQATRNFHKWAHQSEGSGHLSAIEKLARGDARVIAGVDDFDADPHMLACRNGMVNLKTGELRDFMQDEMVTKNTNVVFDPDFALDRWDTFLKESTEGDVELMEYLQLAAGYTLTGSTAAECFFIVSGPPASGKSTFIDAMMAACGTYATTAQSDTFMYKRGQSAATDAIARLAGQRLVTVSEVRQGAMFDEALIKQITGGDRVTARFLYKDAFEFKPQMKIWFATNHDPDTKDEAMWRRIKKIAFRNAVPYEKRDPQLKELLKDPDTGGRAVLAWAVRGAQRFYELGKLEQPTSVTMATAQYQMEQDRFGAFVAEVLVHAPGTDTTLNEVYATYDMWMKSSNETVLRRPQFIQEMRARGVTIASLDSSHNMVARDVALRAVNVSMGWG